MKRSIGFLLACATLWLVGCASEPEAPAPEAFETQLAQFLREGTKTKTMASQGVSYGEFVAQVVNTKAAHDLTLSIWPGDFAAESREDFGKAVEGWDLALQLWELKINKGDNPTEPDVNGFERYVGYALKEMEIDTYDDGYLVADYRGKYYLPFDTNIETLSKLAGTTFDNGRARILSALEEKDNAE